MLPPLQALLLLPQPLFHCRCHSHAVAAATTVSLPQSLLPLLQQVLPLLQALSLLLSPPLLPLPQPLLTKTLLMLTQRLLPLLPQVLPLAASALRGAQEAQGRLPHGRLAAQGPHHPEARACIPAADM